MCHSRQPTQYCPALRSFREQLLSLLEHITLRDVPLPAHADGDREIEASSPC